MPLDSRWYLSAAAVRQYLEIARLRNDDGEGGENFRRAERELAAHSQAARLAADEGHQQIWRTGRVKVGDQPKAIRLELTINTTPRAEGPLLPLVRVRAKG